MRKDIWIDVTVEGVDTPERCHFYFDDQAPSPLYMDEKDACAMNETYPTEVWRVGSLRLRHSYEHLAMVTLWPKPGTPWQHQLPKWGWLDPDSQA